MLPLSILIELTHSICSEEQMHLARKLFLEQHGTSTRQRPTSMKARLQEYALAAQAFAVSANLSLERGTLQLALAHAKSCVRLLRRAWAYVESQKHNQNESSHIAQSQQVSPDESTEMSIQAEKSANIEIETLAPYFWSLVAPLHTALSLVAKIYTFSGLYSETHYYLQEASKVATTVGSDYLNTASSVLLGSTYLKANMLEKATEILGAPSTTDSLAEPGRLFASLSLQRGILHDKLGNQIEGLSSYDSANGQLRQLMDPAYIQRLEGERTNSDEIVQCFSQLKLTHSKKSVPRKAPARPKTAASSKVTNRAKTLAEVKASISEHCILIEADRAVVLRQKIRSLVTCKDVANGQYLLKDIQHVAKTQDSVIDYKIMIAEITIQEVMNQMSVDPVYSVLQESTLSYPAVTVSSNKVGDRLSVVKASPPAKKSLKTNSSQARSKSPMPSSLCDRLKQAQDQLIEVYGLATAAGSNAVVHHITALFNSVTMLLSAFGHVALKPTSLPGASTCSIGM
jgi:separase